MSHSFLSLQSSVCKATDKDGLAGLCSTGDSMSDSRAKGPGFDTQSGHILLFLLSLIQEGQLSVTAKSVCEKYWF